MKKEYPCKLSPTKKCHYGGNKVYNYGFVSGSSSYCYKHKRYIQDLEKCPENRDNKKLNI